MIAYAPSIVGISSEDPSNYYMVYSDTNKLTKYPIGSMRPLECSSNISHDHKTANSTKWPKFSAGNFDFVFSKSSQCGVHNKSWDTSNDSSLMKPVPDKVVVFFFNYTKK